MDEMRYNFEVNSLGPLTAHASSVPHTLAQYRELSTAHASSVPHTLVQYRELSTPHASSIPYTLARDRMGHVTIR
eukprot:3763780-Rhodomonas_salina.3